MLLIFFNTGGITGAEGGVAAGTVVLAQRLLESVFGDEAVRQLAETAKQDLDARVEGLMAGELARFAAVLDRLPIDAQRAEEIRQAAARGLGIGRSTLPGRSSRRRLICRNSPAGRRLRSPPVPPRVRRSPRQPSPAEVKVGDELVPDERAGR